MLKITVKIPFARALHTQQSDSFPSDFQAYLELQAIQTITKQASGTASWTYAPVFPTGLCRLFTLLSWLRFLAHGEQEEFPVKDHISAGRAFLISCKGQMASVDDTQPFKGPPSPLQYRISQLHVMSLKSPFPLLWLLVIDLSPFCFFFFLELGFIY